jgi:DNA-binding MarR family transcriptional regulator
MAYGEPNPLELAGDLQGVLAKLWPVLRRADSTRGTAPDLTLAQLSILVTMLERGPIRMTELASRERVCTPTTTVAIRRLEKAGLVKRSEDPSDLRAVLVEVTPHGLVKHRESLAARNAAMATLLARLSDEDREKLAKAVIPLQRLAHQADDEPAGLTAQPVSRGQAQAHQSYATFQQTETD